MAMSPNFLPDVFPTCSGNYTRHQINLFRIFITDFSVNSQPIFMKFCMNYLRVTRRLPWNFHRKILYI